MRAEKMLLEEDLSGMKPMEIYKMAMAAWNDKKRAGEFTTKVHADRMWRKAGERLEQQEDEP